MRNEEAVMNGKRLGLILVTGSLLLAGCTSMAAAPVESAAIGRSVAAAAKPAYTPFTVDVEPPPKGAAAVVTVQKRVDGDGFIPPLLLAWAKTGSRLYVTTYGPQTCPEVVDHVSSPGLQRLVLHTSMPFSGTSVRPDGQTDIVCTADLSPTTSTVVVPPAINPSIAVVVTINGKAYTLPGRR